MRGGGGSDKCFTRYVRVQLEGGMTECEVEVVQKFFFTRYMCVHLGGGTTECKVEMVVQRGHADLRQKCFDSHIYLYIYI